MLFNYLVSLFSEVGFRKIFFEVTLQAEKGKEHFCVLHSSMVSICDKWKLYQST